MARYSGAEWRPLHRSRPAMDAHNIFCVHTMVGSLAGTEAHWQSSGYDSHFGTGGPSDGNLDGAKWQWLDTHTQSAANYHGNNEVVSLETSDGGDPSQPWSPAQLDAIVDIGAWVCETHNIPPVLIDGNTPGTRGLAYHRQGCDHSSSYRPGGWPYDQWRVRGGVRWSTSLGKTCPGDVRIRQFVDIVVPRIRARVEVDSMSWNERIDWLDWARDYYPGTVDAHPDGYLAKTLQHNAYVHSRSVFDETQEHRAYTYHDRDGEAHDREYTANEIVPYMREAVDRIEQDLIRVKAEQERQGEMLENILNHVEGD